MTPEEKELLQAIVTTLSDPKGNWNYAWSLLCQMAGLNAAECKPPFKAHSLEQGEKKSAAK